MNFLNIDGLNVLRRVYEANLAPDSDAKAAGAVRSATSSIKRALREHRPTHALALFDTAGPNWRHTLYPRYKEDRKPMPAPLREAIPFFLDNLDSLDIAHDAPEGYEADDALGAYTALWSRITGGAPCTVLSTDKDLAQLLQLLGVRIRDHFGDIWRDEAWVQAKFGVGSALLGDFLALTGDSTDGIPGVTKVGTKTAASLLNEHGSLSGVLAAADGIKGKLGERLREERDIALLSRELVSLKLEGPGLMKFSLDDLKLPVSTA